MFAIGRTVKYTLLIGASGTFVGALHSNDWNLQNLGITRFGRAAATVATIAADYKVSLRNFDDESEESKKRWSSVHTRSAKRLLNLCTVNKGAFIKVGQHIASLDYLVPSEYCEILRVLQDQAPESTIKDVKEVIKKDLGQDPSDLFEEFAEKPIGTASLAQVHKAKIRGGPVVAVKVQHSDVRAHSSVDMATMDMLVRIVAKLFPEFSFLWLAEEMRINLPLELDFVHEGKNCERVGRMFSNLKWLKVPEILWEYTSPRVLTMEYLIGGKVTDREYMNRHKLSPKEISEKLGFLYSEMIFVQGYVHCDPHPGNILVSNNDGKLQLILLDHGLYSVLPEKFRHQYSQLWLSLINSDMIGIKKWGIELGAGDLFPLLACILAGKTWDTISKGLTKVRSKNETKAEDNDLKSYARLYFPQIAAVLNRVPREMLLLFKTNDLLKSIEYSLGTRGQKTSLLTMSKCCVKSIYERRLEECGNIFSSLMVRIQKRWQLTKISMYEFYLWFSCIFLTYDA